MLFCGACSLFQSDDDDTNLLGLFALAGGAPAASVRFVPGATQDLDGNGTTDATFLDTNADGVSDALDTDGDGTLNINIVSVDVAAGTAALDVNGDGAADYFLSYSAAGVAALTTQAGGAGTTITVLDSNGDGTTDSLDTDGNGAADVFFAENDYYMGGNVLRKLSLAGTVTVFAGTAGATGTTDATGAAARFNEPIQITQKNGTLYVTEFQNARIRKIGTGDAVVSTPLTGETNPLGIAPLGSNFYFARFSSHRVKQWDGASGTATNFVGSGGTGSNDGTGTAASVSGPWGLASNGVDLFLTEQLNPVVRRITSAGVVTTLAGQAGATGCTDGTGAAARFTTPTGVTTDGRHLYVADTGCCTIRKIAFDTGIVTTFAGVAGDCSSQEGTGIGAKFNQPIGLSTDGTFLYVVEFAANVLRRVDLATGTTATAATGFGFSSAGFGSGSVSNGSRLFVVDRGAHVIRTVD